MDGMGNGHFCFFTQGFASDSPRWSSGLWVPRIPQRDRQRSTARFIDVGLKATAAGKINDEIWFKILKRWWDMFKLCWKDDEMLKQAEIWWFFNMAVDESVCNKLSTSHPLKFWGRKIVFAESKGGTHQSTYPSRLWRSGTNNRPKNPPAALGCYLLAMMAT